MHQCQPHSIPSVHVRKGQVNLGTLMPKSHYEQSSAGLLVSDEDSLILHFLWVLETWKLILEAARLLDNG